MKFLTFKKISVPQMIKGALLSALVRLIFVLKNVLVAMFEKRKFKAFFYSFWFFFQIYKRSECSAGCKDCDSWACHDDNILVLNQSINDPVIFRVD